MMYPQSVIDEIKDRISIVTLIGEYLPLRRAGRNFKGCCPFHKEKTPSFMVSEEKQIYHCFGCSEGGDLFQFVMKQEGATFPEAVRTLAARAGVTLPEPAAGAGVSGPDTARDRHRQLLLRVNQLAAEYYQQSFQDPIKGQCARNYLISRGFIVNQAHGAGEGGTQQALPASSEKGNRERDAFAGVHGTPFAASRGGATRLPAGRVEGAPVTDNTFLTQHFLGYAEDGWEGLVQYLQARKVPMELAVELGLVRPRKEGKGYYDFFRHRLIFPIRGPRGELCGFGARALPDAHGVVDAETAKYLNSSDSLVYHKGRTVYGIAAAAQAMRAADRALIVEGYLDVLACHQAGVTETVAPLGTALTADHVRLLRRYTRNFWLIFDGDAAGRQAAERSLPVFLAEGLIPRMVLLPDGEDPDSFLRQQGREALLALLPQAPTLFEWVIDHIVEAAGHDTAGKARAVEQLRPFFAALTDAVEEAVYVRRLAQRIGVEEGVVRKGLKGKNVAGCRSPVASSPDVTDDRRPATSDAALQSPAERALLEFILQAPTAMALVAHRLQPSEFRDPAARAIAASCWRVYEERGELVVAHLVEQAAEQQLITALAFGAGKYDDPENWPRLAEELIAAVRRPQWHDRLRELNQAIAQAERDGRAHDLAHLMTEKQHLLKERDVNALWNANR